MPLLDHFHPPLNKTHPWRSFHGAWAAAMARLLNAGVLPAGYYAMPFLNREGSVEIDVATVYYPHSAVVASGELQPWTAPEPGLAVAVEWPDEDGVRVEIHSDDGDTLLAAAIELVSPGNKDRPRTREAFAAKCADYLGRGCGLVVVDTVSIRRADLRADLWAALGLDGVPPAVGSLSAVSYRSIGRNGDGRLLAWPSPLVVGQPLPTLPLWLGAEIAVPLDLELSHTAACADLRIPVR